MPPAAMRIAGTSLILFTFCERQVYVLPILPFGAIDKICYIELSDV